MGLLGNILLVLVGLLSFLSFQIYRHAFAPAPKPEFDVNAYWGVGNRDSYKEDTAIYPFQISYSEEIINKLKTRLDDYPNFPPPLEGVNFEYGFNTDYLKQVIKYWRESYLGKWELRQKYLNKFPHFKIKIQGLDIHFIHLKPSSKPSKPVLPLLLLHGWPGSVVEFYALIDKLKANEEFGFEIVAPSLPGYGWSQASAKIGMGPIEIGVIMRNLMIRLGHQKFYVQGGDWGSLIGSNIATLFPENVIAYHSNMCVILSVAQNIKTMIAGIYPSYFVPQEYVHWYYPMWDNVKFNVEESGYLHIQATKPDTIGAALTGNPIGLAAYILEKFSTGTNRNYRQLPDGGLTKRFTMDALLDNIMIYYLTDSITTSQRLYSEGFSLRSMSKKIDRVPTSVPTGCTRFRYDIFPTIDWVLQDKYLNLIHSTYNPDGGHFAAMEVPDTLYKDMITFIQKVQKHDKA